MNAARRPLSFHDSARPQRLERGDGRYPGELEDLQADAPPALSALGRLETLDARPRVAVVGTRRATAYGLRVTAQIARALANAGACVVSGLARGIDGAAHRAALDADGATIAVLGTGLDHAFPRAHRELQAEIAARGLLLTELEPWEHGFPSTFLHRNRIIAALCSVTIVIEAPERSGALNTAGHALSLGRVVAAVPGPIDQPQSAGANTLLRDGAQVIACVEDALMLAGLTASRAAELRFDGDEGVVWAALGEGAVDLETLCHRSGLPASRCLVAVTALELAGSIECALSGQIRRR